MAAPGPPARTGRPRKASTAGASHAGPSHQPGESSTSASTPAGERAGTTGGGPSIAPGTAMHSNFPATGPMTVADCENFAAQLTDPACPARRRQEVAVELRDSAENNKDYAFYAKYLEILMPVVLGILGEEKTIAFQKESPDQRLRHALLTFINRLPKTEPFRAHETPLMELAVKLLRIENEENALICIKIMIDAFRNHKDQAEPFVHSFLDCVKIMYGNLRSVVEKEYGSPSQPSAKANTASLPPVPPGSAPPATPASATPSASGDAPNPPLSAAPGPSSNSTPLARALYSAKVLTECPIAVVLVFQTYKTTMAAVMEDFYPLVMDMIQTQPEPQRLAYEEGNEKGYTFVGVAPGIHNREMFTEVIKAQVKTMAFLAYVLRGSTPVTSKDHLEVFPEVCIRLLRNCPPEDVGTRKELLVATRHILQSESRNAFIPYIGLLLEERVLVGTGITARETLRPLAFSVIADLIHHVRTELSLERLGQVVHVMSVCLNDATFNGAIQTMCAKLLNTIVEAINSKGEPAEAHRLLRSMFFTKLEKLKALTEAYERLKTITVRDKGKARAKEKEKEQPTKPEPVQEDVIMDDEEDDAEGDEVVDTEKMRREKELEKEKAKEQEDRLAFGWREIEQAMPVHAVAYAGDSIEQFCKEARFLFKTLLHTFRTLLQCTRAAENPMPSPDGDSLSQFFEYSLRCLAIFEGVRDPREQKEAVELLSQILLLFEPHIFASVWTINMDSFVQNAPQSPHFFPVLQMLITHETVSTQLVGILLKYLMGHIHELGDYTPQQATLVLKLFKTGFLAINTFIVQNESVLVPHLQKLILSCFEYAALADDGAVYYQILRALFRSIGGGRFEALYKEVLPILQEMLDTLSQLLEHAADDTERDLYVELTLTVPVRLTNLLPHLSYLMKPLVHALRAGPDSVSQGLRTLELCIDNLTADFLDPTMGPILRDLMAGLHKLLKPVPANRHHAHSAIRILGKLGGRNRRFQEVDHLLEYSSPTSDIPVPIYIEGKKHTLQLGPIVSTASMALERALPEHAEDSLKVLMVAALAVLQPDGPASEGNETFIKAMSGLFMACQVPALSNKATEFVRNFCRRVFAAERLRKDTKTEVDRIVSDMTRKRYLPLTSAVADCFVNTLASSRLSERDGLCQLLATIMADFRALAPESDGVKKADPVSPMDKGLQTFIHRFCSLCHEADWNRKLAGVAAIRMIIQHIDVNRKLLYELEVELVRALLFCLRDAPLKAPKSAEGIIDLIQEILRACRQPNEKSSTRLAKLVETLVIELNSQSHSSRQCAQRSIATLAEIADVSIHDLIKDPAKTKLLDPNAGPIFAKPLRALPFAMQVANIDAVTYLTDIRPQLIDTTEEFVRLSHEVIALADVGDDSLISKPTTQKQEYWIKALRISCLKLLRAAMNLPNFNNQAQLIQTRTRVVNVYFKHVYSSEAEIVECAHEGLRDSINAQHKLPKELLQTGLRPILVNLADAKRLNVTGLDGLARFLELLTSYFKLEIGVKLLEHFQALCEPQSLQKAAFSPLEDNQDIARMSRLVNVFRLLPTGAEEYLQRLTDYVVNAEAHLHQFVPGPLTTSMTKYFEKYHVTAVQNLFDNIRIMRYVWTYRNIIQSGEAEMLVDELTRRIEEFCTLTLSNPEAVEYVIPGLQILNELAKTSEMWFADKETVLEFLVAIWRVTLAKSRTNDPTIRTLPHQQIPTLILELFMRFLKTQRHVPLLFHLVEAFEIKSAFERSSVAFFLYQHAALQDSVTYRREVLDHFFNLYEEDSVTWEFKANALRLVINPLLRVYFASPNDGSLFAPTLTVRLTNLIWRPLSNTHIAKMRDDDLLVEIFALTTLMVQHCPPKVSDARKDIFKLAWMGVNLLEPTVKLMAYNLAARFMATFDTPMKFLKLTWTGLLRLKDTENRILYREAIDILARCLRNQPVEGEKKADAAPVQPHVTPEWALRVRTILTEEGHAISQLVTVCELLVAHPDQFYEYRELYVPHIANSLSKLAFVGSSTPDFKKLTVDVVELIFRWERRRMAARDEAMEIDESSSKRRSDKGDVEESPLKRQKVTRAGTAVSTSSGGGWAAPTQVRELMTAHLLRLVSSSPDPVSRGGLTKRALDLFKEILGPNGLVVHVKLSFFNRTMKADITDNNINIVANSTEVIAAVAAAKDQSWIKQNLGTLTGLLEKVWVFDEPSLHDTVESVTDKMFQEMPEEEGGEAEKEGKDLYTFVSTAVNDGLTSSLRSSSSLPGTLFLLRAWLKVQPKQLQTESIATGLLKVLQNLTKVHTTNPNAPDQAHRLIISVLDVLRGRVADLREHRRTLNGVMLSLIDKSTHPSLCRYLLETMKQWVLDDPEPTSQGKEKATLLLRMSVYEQRDETLFQRYLDLIYDVYERADLRGTDLTHRLESAFLLGTRSRSQDQRTKFLDKLEQSLPRTLDGRLQYLYSLQNWDTLSDSYWIPQILSMILAIVDTDRQVISRSLEQVKENDPLIALAASQISGDILGPARNLIHINVDLARRLWTNIFPKCWASLTRAQQVAFTPYIIKLLSKDHHRKQVELRPNVIQTFLEGILACVPVVTLPPLLVKYLAKSFDAWYIGFEFLHKLSDLYRGDDELRENCARALSELYAELCEDDMFYGLARSRCVYPETTAALTYEQNGLWPQAIEMYEQAQMKARNGLLPFSEDEYCFWEDHWVLAAQKLQNWDSLTELARTDQDSDLLLECAWRISDWGSSDRETIESSLNRVIDVPTPRRKTFEAYTALLKAHGAREPPNDFLRVLDEAQQVTLKKWASLPSHTTAAHLPLLQMFQQCIELTEASLVFDSLQQTNQTNLEMRATSDLKPIFTTWRERLPNFWDDISVWSDLLAWRQHVFQAVTKVYVPLIPQGETATYGFRGYHETAWTINRFGEMARRHNLLDVCSAALNKIYSLPNIEISEAFLKLREQALCYFQKPDKFNEGLENISTTNLMYFTPAQKAEFLTLKGVFIAQLGQYDEANAEFAHAIQMDINLPKAWAEWGRFNDRLYRERPAIAPEQIPEPEPGKPPMSREEWQARHAQDRAVFASHAVSCYLQAAGLYNNHKARALLLRILWLLGLDDSHNTIAKAFENYKGDLILWYWITLIPQLLMSLSHREAKQARLLLLRIAKVFPQALFYQLRVTKEDFTIVKRQQATSRMHAQRKAAELARAASMNAQAQAQSAAAAATPAKPADGEDVAMSNGDKADKADASQAKDEAQAASTSQAMTAPPTSQPPAQPTENASQQAPNNTAAPNAPRQPWELADEIMNSMKSSFPLLTLTMEKMVDQIAIRAKPASDEDIYRFFAALLADALQQWGNRVFSPGDDGELNAATKDNLIKFSTNLSGDMRNAIEKDFMNDTPKLREYIRRLQHWRDSYERGLDARPRFQPLDQGGCNLIDFHHAKFDDVEVPGQYVHHVDHSEEFIKIARFAPRHELARGHGHCYRRITMIGHDTSVHSFSVQMPAARHCRREERLTQLFRILNSVLRKRKEARRRNIQFHLPAAIALAPQLRLVENDASYISLQDVYDEYSKSKGRTREASVMTFYDRVKELSDAPNQKDQRLLQIKTEVLEEIQLKMVPENILSNYMIRSMRTSESLWLMRKQFALQTAGTAFLTYLCCLHNRAPNRFHISRRTGLMYMTEILPGFAHGQPMIQSSESCPFRLTPNMQHFITRVGIEGVMTAAVTAISKSLTSPGFDLAETLSSFVRDELLTWHHTYMKDNKTDSLNRSVEVNVDQFVRRVTALGYIGENQDKAPNAAPVVHAIVTLISQATSPNHLAQMSENYMAWF